MEGKIYAAISNVMKDVGAVGKNSRNENGKYDYRGIDAIMNALSPAMSRNGIFAVPQTLETSREERTSRNGGVLIYSVLKVKYIFYAEDGSSVEAIVTGEAMDSGDKSVNKAMSAAYKYACFQVFCIPTAEMVDSDKDTYEVSPTPNRDMSHQKNSIAEKINRSKLFPDEEILLIGTKDVKGKRFKEVKNREVFLRFLNHISSQDYKFEDAKMQEQFLRLKTLHQEIVAA